MGLPGRAYLFVPWRLHGPTERNEASETRVELSIRPMARTDVPYIVDYWCRASPGDLERMGVDASKIPRPEAFRAQLENLAGGPGTQARSFYLIWLADGRPVGYSSLKNIVRGRRAEMHLHMWDAPSRGRGYGATLFCRSALDFFARFRPREMVCEPSAKNPMPNAMLRRVGFRLLGSRVGASSELSQVCELHTYAIEPQVAERFLARGRA
jgi:RimJ/RimL family protein N-acetyltransferase